MKRAGSRFRRAALGSAFALMLVPAVSRGQGDPVQDRLQSLEQEVALLKRQLEVKNEADAQRTREQAVLAAGKDGFGVQSADKKFQLRLRGYAQFDGRVAGRPDDLATDTFSIRRARLNFEGTLAENIDFRIMPDFAGSQLTLFDAYLNLRWRPQAQFQIGKFKPPVGLERLQSATALTFIERGFPTLFVPNRDVGMQVHGELMEGAIAYQFGAFNGVRDSGNIENRDVDTDDGKDFAGRLFVRPFANGSIDVLRGLGLGFAATIGDEDQALPSYGNSAQPAFFSYRAAQGAVPAAVAKGDRVRLAPQGYWYWGPFSALTEYTRIQQEVERGAADTRVTHDAWQLALGWVVTGENASFRGVTPRSEFGSGGWGAIELAARVQGIEFDDDVFPLFADPNAAIEEALGVTVGVNWYINRNVKLSLNYDHINYDGGRSAGRDRETEDVILTRVQLAY
jgi:phosphate-selective porin OprO and OprP